MKTILKAVRVPDFDMVGDEHYGDRPYGVVLDVYDTNDNFIENGTDWSYFATEEEAENFCNEYNKSRRAVMKTITIPVAYTTDENCDQKKPIYDIDYMRILFERKLEQLEKTKIK